MFSTLKHIVSKISFNGAGPRQRLSCAINRQEATQSNLKLKKKNQANGIFLKRYLFPKLLQ